MANHEAGWSVVSVKVVIYWLIVGIPLIWGVVETLQSALKLFE